MNNEYTVVEVEEVVEDPSDSSHSSSVPALTYRYLPPDEWPRILPLLSYTSPGRSPDSITLDPLSQSVIVVETSDRQPIAAAIISGVFHVAYLIPTAKEVNILTMQREVERLLPPRSTYYTMVGDGPEADVMQDELGMTKIDGGPVMFLKRVEER